MKTKRRTSKRTLIAQPLESRELLAANFLGRATVPPDNVQVNEVSVVQVQTQAKAAGADQATSQQRGRDGESLNQNVSTVTQAPSGNQNSNLEAATQRGKNGGGANNTASRLSQSEIDQLLFIREEEKLARDVYLALSEDSNAKIFANIAASEQRHMDAIGNLIDKYGLEDPVKDDTPGVFTNETLQQLYDDLVSDDAVDLSYLDLDLVIDGGATSPIAALKVGVFIEEFDILDLQHAIDHTTHTDVASVYESLLKGSRNHLSAFVGQIEATGETYVPLLMTEDADIADDTAVTDNRQTKNGQQGRRSETGNDLARSSSRTSPIAADNFFSKLGQKGSQR